MKITGCSFAFLLLLCLAGCDLGGGSGCPDGQQCCEVSAAGNGMGPWKHVCMDSCPADSTGSVDSSYCSQSSSSLRKPETPLVGQHVSLPGSTDRAVLLFTSPSCRFASANDSFHRALYKTAVESGIPFYVVVAQRGDEITFKNRTEFAHAPVLLASELPFHLVGTPTVMLVRSGQIHAAWIGERKTVEQQQEILSRITKAGIIHPQ
jgi:hypothetical protein